MQKIKVKKIKIPGGTDKDTASLFNQMLGSDNLNLDIAYPRYRLMKLICENLVCTLNILITTNLLRIPILEAGLDEVKIFHDNCVKEFADLFDMDFSACAWNLKLLEDHERERFQKKYQQIKNSKYVLEFVATRHILIDYRASLADENALKSAFITTMKSYWYPFSFAKLDLVDAFVHITQPAVRNIFLLALHKILLLSDKLFNELQSPDIDISSFITTIMANIDQVKSVPELSRCGKAFAKIKESVDLLKKNFNGYYRNFVQTGCTTTIMENFVADVSFNTKADAETTRQFRTIMSYYRKVASHRSGEMSPQVKTLFEKINDSFSKLDHGGKERVKIDDVDNAADTSGPTLSTGAISVNDILDSSSEEK